MGIYQRKIKKDRRGMPIIGKNGKPKKEGPWTVQYPYSRDPETGRIKCKNERVSWNKKTAQDFFRKKQEAFLQREKQGLQTESDMTLWELFEWGLEEEVMKSKKSAIDDRIRVGHLKTGLPNVKARDINPLMVNNFKIKMKKTISKKTGKPYSGATVNKTINVARRIYNLAIDAVIMEKNPFARVGAYKEVAKGKYIPEEDFWKLYKYLPEYLKPVALVGYYTGMRRGEIIDLTWDRVDRVEEFIDLTEESTKTGEPRRIPFKSLPILGETFRKLEKVKSIEHGNVFLWKGKPIHPQQVSRCFRKACNDTDVKPYRFHDLRHTFNTNMQKAGVDRVRIMKLTGHKTMNMFLRYSHIDEDGANDAMAKLNNFLCGESGVLGEKNEE